MSQRRLVALALSTLCFALWDASAHADPVVISASDAIGPPGAPGTGACAVARLAPIGQSLGQLATAEALLDGPLVQAAGEKRFVFATPDYTNGTLASLGDFTANEPMPFTVVGTPAGPGEGIAIRIKGTLRVEAAGTVTFGLRSDDGFRIVIAGATVLDHPAVQTSKVASRVVVFESSGRYPFELEYFENRFDAALEWSLASGAHAEVFESQSLPDATFALLPTAMLVAPDDDPDACGATCAVCPASAPMCSAGVCIARNVGGGGAGGAGGAGDANVGGGGAPPGNAESAGSGGSGGFGVGGFGIEGSGGAFTNSSGGAGASRATPTLWGTSICSTAGVGRAPVDPVACVAWVGALTVLLRRRACARR